MNELSCNLENLGLFVYEFDWRRFEWKIFARLLVCAAFDEIGRGSVFEINLCKCTCARYERRITFTSAQREICRHFD